MEEFRNINCISEYEVSSYGRIRHKKTKAIATLYVDKKGYNTFNSKLVHILVALAFIPNPLGKPIVDHMDRLRTNNYVGNLRWATKAENNVNTGRINQSSGLKGISYCNELDMYTVRLVNDQHGALYLKNFFNRDDAIIDRVEQMLLKYGEFVSHDEVLDYCEAIKRKGINNMMIKI